MQNSLLYLDYGNGMGHHITQVHSPPYTHTHMHFQLLEQLAITEYLYSENLCLRRNIIP